MKDGYSVTNKDIPEVFAMWGDVFKFQKKFYNPPHLQSDKSNDEEVKLFWEACIADSDEILNRYKNMKLCSDIMVAILNDISERGKSNDKE